MGYYVIVGHKFERHLASIGGWKAFKMFLNTFRDEDLQNVKHFVDYAWTQDLPVFVGELIEMQKHGPDEGVSEIIRDLIDTINAGPFEDDCIFLTDGVLKDDVKADPSDFVWDSCEDIDDDDEEPTAVKKNTARTSKSKVKQTAPKNPHSKKATVKKISKKTPAKASTNPPKKTAKKAAKKKRWVRVTILNATNRFRRSSGRRWTISRDVTFAGPCQRRREGLFA